MEGFKPYGWYLTLVQFAFYSIFGLIELQLIQDKRRRYVDCLVFSFFFFFLAVKYMTSSYFFLFYYFGLMEYVICEIYVLR